MSVKHFHNVIQSHLHILKKLCPKAKGFYYGVEPESIFNDVFRLEIPNYIIATFSPTKGYYIFGHPDKKTEKDLIDMFSHWFTCHPEKTEVQD